MQNPPYTIWLLLLTLATVLLAAVAILLHYRRRQEQMGGRLLRSLADKEQQLGAYLDQGLVGIYIIQAGVFTYVNARLASLFGYTPELLINKATVQSLVAPESRQLVLENVNSRLEGRVTAVNYEFSGLKADGTRLYVEVYGTTRIIHDKPAVVGLLVDRTASHRDSLLLGWQKTVYSRYSQDGDINAAATLIMHALEEVIPDSIASVLKISEQGSIHQLGHNRLPPEFNTAIEGAHIGPNAGSCGTAAFRGQRIVVEDISTDPLWASYKELALAHQLQACWSTPVKSDGRVMATFAVYYRSIRHPEDWEIESIDQLSDLLRVVLEQDKMAVHLRQSQQRLTDAEMLARLGHWSWDLSDNRLTWSRQARQLMEISESQGATLESAFARVADEDRELLLSGIRENAAIGVPLVTTFALKAAGQVKRIRLEGRGEEGGTFFAIMQDVTELQKVRERLQQANAELERKIAARTAELETSNRELEAFSYSVSHDLRAPLRAINGFAQAVVDDFGADLPQQAQGFLARIQRNADRMAELIDDLLKLSRVTRHEIHLTEVNVSDLAHEVSQQILENTGALQVKLDIEDGLRALADRELLGIVLGNLFENAIKYSSKEEHPHIRLYQSTLPDKEVFTIQDNGVGFNQEDAGKLFVAFRRLHSEREFPGTGIGLATVARVIHRHSGSIWAEAETGVGARFSFTLAPRHMR